MRRCGRAGDMAGKDGAVDREVHGRGEDNVSLDELAEYMRRAVEALDQLAKAVAEHQALPSEMVRLAEAVSSARGALYRGLIASGWTAPNGTEDGIALDERLVTESVGSQYDGRWAPEPD